MLFFSLTFAVYSEKVEILIIFDEKNQFNIINNIICIICLELTSM